MIIPIINYESNNPDETIYSFSIKYNEKLYTKNIMWKSPNKNISKPSKTANNFQDFNSTYYYCYTFTYFINLLNDNIIELFEEINEDLIFLLNLNHFILNLMKTLLFQLF